MKQHRYRITVDYLADKDGTPPAAPSSLQFETGNASVAISMPIPRPASHWA